MQRTDSNYAAGWAGGTSGGNTVSKGITAESLYNPYLAYTAGEFKGQGNQRLGNWTDLTNRNRNAIQNTVASRPTLIDGASPYVDFAANGAGSMLVPVVNSFFNGRAYSILGLISLPTPATRHSGILFSIGSNVAPQSLWVGANNLCNGVAFSLWGGPELGSALAANNWGLSITSVSAAGAVSHYVNGVKTTGTAKATIGTANPATMGYSNVNTTGANIKVKLFALYDFALSDEQAAALKTFLLD